MILREKSQRTKGGEFSSASRSDLRHMLSPYPTIVLSRRLIARSFRSGLRVFKARPPTAMTEFATSQRPPFRAYQSMPPRRLAIAWQFRTLHTEFPEAMVMPLETNRQLET